MLELICIILFENICVEQMNPACRVATFKIERNALYLLGINERTYRFVTY